MAPLNALIKSWKIQNIRLTKHYPFFKIFSNKSFYMSVIRILIQYFFFQKKKTVLLFLKIKTVASMLNLLDIASVNKVQRLFIFFFLPVAIC